MSGDTPTPSSAASAAPSSASRAILLEARRVSGGIDALSAAAARCRQTGRAVCRRRRQRRSPARPAQLRRAQPPDDRDASRLPSPAPPQRHSLRGGVAHRPPAGPAPAPPGGRRRRRPLGSAARAKKEPAHSMTHTPPNVGRRPHSDPHAHSAAVFGCADPQCSHPFRVSRVRIGSLARARARRPCSSLRRRERGAARGAERRAFAPLPRRRRGTANGSRQAAGRAAHSAAQRSSSSSRSSSSGRCGAATWGGARRRRTARGGGGHLPSSPLPHGSSPAEGHTGPGLGAYSVWRYADYSTASKYHYHFQEVSYKGTSRAAARKRFEPRAPPSPRQGSRRSAELHDRHHS